MEVTKRTYQKHKTEYKITVKHYLNTTVNEYDNHGNSVYPYYVQVTHRSKNTRFRSRIKPVFQNQQYRIEISPDEAILRDIAFIEFLIKGYEKYNSENDGKYDVSDLASFYHSENFELVSYVDDSLRHEIVRFIYDNVKTEDVFEINLYENIKPLTYFENLKVKYPILNLLRQEYNSNVWTFDIYVEQLRHNDNFETGIKPDLYNSYLALWKPTIKDYQDKFIQKALLLHFNNSQDVINIFKDIEKLISNTEDEYFRI